jgi:hypothetical protein
MASLQWLPTPRIVDECVAGWREAFGDDSPPLVLDRFQPMKIGFHTPLLHEMKISYGVNQKRNRAAGRAYSEMRERAGKYDVWGSEWITERTLIAISEVFK